MYFSPKYTHCQAAITAISSSYEGNDDQSSRLLVDEPGQMTWWILTELPVMLVED
jgi:hypothetical protein